MIKLLKVDSSGYLKLCFFLKIYQYCSCSFCTDLIHVHFLAATKEMESFCSTIKYIFSNLLIWNIWMNCIVSSACFLKSCLLPCILVDYSSERIGRWETCREFKPVYILINLILETDISTKANAWKSHQPNLVITATQLKDIHILKNITER